VIIDDIIDTAAPSSRARERSKEAGATKVYACATHGLFNGEALQRVADSDIHKLVVTDTVPARPAPPTGQHQVLSIATILAETIHERVRGRLGLGDLRGENQLF
jgi:ribose-phosphate pyrophosphokinase